MRFEWDESKRQSNLDKHGLDFVEVSQVFEGVTTTVLDNRFGYSEDRFVTFGLLMGRVVAIAHTETDELIRIISAREATRYEEETYFREITN